MLFSCSVETCTGSSGSSGFLAFCPECFLCFLPDFTAVLESTVGRTIGFSEDSHTFTRFVLLLGVMLLVLGTGVEAGCFDALYGYEHNYCFSTRFLDVFDFSADYRWLM